MAKKALTDVIMPPILSTEYRLIISAENLGATIPIKKERKALDRKIIQILLAIKPTPTKKIIISDQIVI
ncbi:hypothetical protein SuUB56_19680 [Streptococcus uberis]